MIRLLEFYQEPKLSDTNDKFHRRLFSNHLIYDDYRPAGSKHVRAAIFASYMVVGMILLTVLHSNMLAIYHKKRFAYTVYWISFALLVVTLSVQTVFFVLCSKFINSKGPNGLHATLYYQAHNVIGQDSVKANTTTYSWKMISQEFRCCGAGSPDDFIGSFFTNTTGEIVPEFCCVLNHSNEEKRMLFEDAPNNTGPINRIKCYRQAEFWYSPTPKGIWNMVYTKGCSNEVAAWLNEKLKALHVLSFLTFCAEIVTVSLISCYVCSDDETVARVDKQTNITMPNRMI